MNPLRRLLTVSVLACLLAAPALSAADAATAPKAAPPGEQLAKTIAQITGVAISPLMGVSAVGAYTYFKTPAEQHSQMPWYCHPAVWLAGLGLVGAAALKDTLGVAVPAALKKPLDVVDALENKASGLVTAAAFVPITVAGLTEYLSDKIMLGQVTLGGVAIPLATIDWSPLLNVLLVPFTVAVYLMVWLTAHAINVLILLSPFSLLDTTLKAVRLSVLSLLTLVTYLNPWVGAALSLVIMVVAYFLAGWAFRLMVFGSVFVWDFLSLRRRRFDPAVAPHFLFTARSLEGAPLRSYGRLEKTADGPPRFTYRPWGVLSPRTIDLPAGRYAVGLGFLYSSVTQAPAAGDQPRDLLTLPPRYRSHETAFGRIYGWSAEAVGLRRGWKVMIEWLRGAAKSGAAGEASTVAG